MKSRRRTHGRVRRLTPGQAVVKAVCRAQRETVGFTAPVTQRNRRKYHRPSERMKGILEQQC